MSSFLPSFFSTSSRESVGKALPKSPEEIRGEELIRRAVQAEENNPEEALRLYREALEVWVEVLRLEADDGKRNKLSLFIDHYMKCAENLKCKINESTKPASSVANLKNYTSQTISSAKKAPGRTRGATKLTATPQPRRQAPRPSSQTQSRPSIRGQAKSDSGNEYESQMMSELLDSSPGVRWSDIAGLEYAKRTIHEAVVMPNMRPDLFSGLRAPPKGVLLYGPPGTGKTMLAKAIATESGFKFFSISSSSVTSKFLGEGEKLMKAVFELARKNQPSVIFFDEIDALLSSRKENEHEASRRLKTEFMIQLDGAASNANDRILIIGATNIPWELDEAVLRRLVKRIYVPLPEAETRLHLITYLIQKQENSCGGGKFALSKKCLQNIVKQTGGYSASDLTALCKEAAMGPLREIPPEKFATFDAKNLRPISEGDFKIALQNIRPSVSTNSLERYRDWSSKFGTQS